MHELTQGVTELLGLVSVFAGLDNDCLSTGEAAGSEDNNLTTLDAEMKQSHKSQRKNR